MHLSKESRIDDGYQEPIKDPRSGRDYLIVDFPLLLPPVELAKPNLVDDEFTVYGDR